MKNNNHDKNNYEEPIEIEPRIYEFMSLWAASIGYEDVNEFINDVLEAGIECELEERKKEKEASGY